MVKRITFETLLDEIKSQWKTKEKNFTSEGIDLFNVIKEIFEFIYFEKNWAHNEKDDNFPSRKGALYDFFKKELTKT